MREGKVQTGRLAGTDMVQVQETGYRKQKLESTEKKQYDSYNDLIRDQRISAGI